MAHLSENFIFIYLGITVFTLNEILRFPLILLTFIGILFSRGIVFPLAALINFIHKRKTLFQIRRRRQSENHIQDESQTPDLDANEELIPRNHQVMLWWAGLRGAIAFALSMDIEMKNDKVVKTTVLMVVVLSILVLGGTTSFALRKFRVKTGIQPETSSEDTPSTGNHWFIQFDRTYLIPLFTRTDRRIFNLEDQRDSRPLLLSNRTSNEVVALVEMEHSHGSPAEIDIQRTEPSEADLTSLWRKK
jgi:NhaP-type Na+/H+ or K+/H+ antiporter